MPLKARFVAADKTVCRLDTMYFEPNENREFQVLTAYDSTRRSDKFDFFPFAAQADELHSLRTCYLVPSQSIVFVIASLYRLANSHIKSIGLLHK